MTQPVQSAYKYNFDKSTKDPVNLIADEVHSFAGSAPRVLVAREGMFWVTDDKPVLIDVQTGQPLVHETDYVYIGYDGDVTALSGYPAIAGIELKNQSFQGDIKFTYQAVGGPEGMANSLIRELIAAINEAVANPTVTWASILNKPAYFTPAEHTHPPDQVSDLDVLAREFRALITQFQLNKPLKNSPQNLLNSISILLSAMSDMRRDINNIAAVNGLGSQIAELNSKINTTYKNADIVKEIAIGQNTLIASHDLAEFTSIDLIITVRGVDEPDMAISYPMRILSSGTLAKHSFGRVLKFDPELPDPAQLLVVNAGGKINISVDASHKVNVTVKYLALI